MASQQHIVQKFTIEIGLPDSERAFALQTKITNDYQRLFLKSMNEVFDQLVGIDEVVIVDKLEIDLGAFSPEEMEQELPEKIKKEIEEALSNLLNQARADKNNFTAVHLTTASGTAITVHVKVQRTSQSLFETLLYFLEYGIVPWSADGKQKPDTRYLVSEAMIHHPEELRRALLTLSSRKYIFRRLAFQLPGDQLQYLAAILECNFSAALDTLINSMSEWVRSYMQKVTTAKPRISSQNKKNRSALPDFTSADFPTSNASTGFPTGSASMDFPSDSASMDFPSDSASTDFSSGNASTDFSPAFLKQKIWEETLHYFVSPEFRNGNVMGETAMIKYVATVVEHILATARIKPSASMLKEFKSNEMYSNIIKAALEQLILTHKKSIPVNESAPAVATVKKNEEYFPEAPDIEEGVYIKNAGLVILAPYLPGFFRNLGLVEGKEFINEEAKWKAVHILQWLAEGDKDVAEGEDEILTEHDLLLNKIICGMDIAEPIPVTLELTPSDKLEGMTLLISIIANWSIIKNSSVHTLRTTFLQKEGRLSREDENWNLFIHRDSAIDMLIDKLPWGIAMTKLPWNKRIVYVEW
ncbi:MAG: contractile injection system tape measure protein [Bacteroidia bacterium]